MMRYIHNTLLAGLITVSVLIPSLVLAQTAPPPSAPAAVDVPAECSVSDTTGATHNYSGSYLGICALVAAKDAGIVSAYTFQNFSFGLFLASLNGISPGATEFWALYHNGSEASVGLTDLVVVKDDILKLQLKDWMSNSLVGSPVEFSIRSLIAQAHSSGTKPEFMKERPFSVHDAVQFLVREQKNDGSFGAPLFTDWAALAFSAAAHDAALCEDACRDSYERLREYMRSETPALSSATDYERHAMALLALGLNPYSDAGIDYITPIVEAFDGEQVGDPTLVNDDIFAVFPLLHSGYSAKDPMLQAILAFVLPRQKADGSWEGSIDLTAAAAQAIRMFPEVPGAAAALERAEMFLRYNQNESGIFGHNSFSLSWALQAIAAFGDTPDDWRKSGLSPLGYLGVFQQEDGGMEPLSASADIRAWATSYAIPAALGRTWGSLLASFEKPTQTPTPAHIAQKVIPVERAVPVSNTLVQEPDPAGTENQTEESAATTSLAQSAAASSAIEGDLSLFAFLFAGLLFGFALLFWGELRKLFS